MISYIGGKSKIGKWIVPFYPSDIETYVEPFSGMFWCFFNMGLDKYPNLKKVVYNDYNPLNYNLFKCVQNPSELQKHMDKIPVQQFGVSDTPVEYKEMFHEFQKELFSDIFLVGEADFLRITNVENLDFQQVIEKYDSPSTYIYLDPPYWKTENYYSNHDFDRKDHERLANVLNGVKGKFSLSYYDFEILKEWYPVEKFRWEKKEFAKAAAAKKGVKQNMAQELLILNY